MTATEPITHIRLDPNGVAWINATNVKVIEVAVDKLAHRCTAEEMQSQYAHLSLSQIYAALAYYHDQNDQFDAQIQTDLHEVSALREAAGELPKAEQLRTHTRRP